MNKIIICFLVMTVHSQLFAINEPVNGVIGDDGFKVISGRYPTTYDTEKKRVQYHLLYAEFLLRRVDVTHLSHKKREKRKKMLDYLHEYAMAGIYPKNQLYPRQRKPCFIDLEGNLCAVGYLVEESAGRQVAEEINSLFQYATIAEMDTTLIRDWAESNGLTIEECALIQPTYNFVPRPMYQRTMLFNLGSSYRLGTELYSTFDMTLVYRPKLWKYLLNQVVISYTPLKSQNHSVSLSFGKYLYVRGKMRAYANVGGEYFSIDQRNGWNIFPETGVAFQHVKGRVVFDAKLAYGYHFSLTNEKFYNTGRNDITGTIGVGVKL